MTARRALSGLVVLLAVACVSSCQKKEEAAAAPTAAPPPSPPAVSVAPLKEPEPAASVAAPAASVAQVAAAASGVATPEPSAATTEPKKVVPGGDLTACCAAIGAAAKKPGKNQNRYTTATAICTGLEKAVKSGKANFTSAKATLKLQLAGAPVPNGC